MNYPIWTPPIVGGGLLIAIVAILHVFISHFAVGGGLFLAVWEGRARKRGDAVALDYLRRHSFFFMLVSLVLGAITGVGIWFVIQLIQPTGTSALIHNYVWGWAIEWVFFIVEIVAAILYYLTWKTLDGRRHLLLAWIYFAAAFLSLVVINGIITFMLTPGRWIEKPAFWVGFFNPTYFPSLVFRTGVCIGLAGIYAMLTLVRQKDEAFRLRAVRSAGGWIIAGFLLMAVSTPWYVASIPAEAQTALAGQWPELDLWMMRGMLCTAGVVLISLLFAVARPKLMSMGVAVALMLLGVGHFAAFEMIRELIRKPYVVAGHIYSNSLYVDEVETAREKGLLEYARWVDRGSMDTPVARGRQVYDLACAACHTLDGYRSIDSVMAGYDADRLRKLFVGMDDMRWQMPPFPGNERDADDLVAFLAPRMSAAPEATTGEEVFEKRCFACHDLAGEFRPLAASLEGMGTEEMDEYIGIFEMDDSLSMPAFGGTEEERRLLLEWIHQEVAVQGGDS
jgi:mono/diheme cytochrome c family protein